MKKVKLFLKKLTFGLKKRILFFFFCVLIVLMVSLYFFNFWITRFYINLSNAAYANCISMVLNENIDYKDILDFQKYGLDDPKYHENYQVLNRVADDMGVDSIYVLSADDETLYAYYCSRDNYYVAYDQYHDKEIKNDNGEYIGYRKVTYSSQEEKERYKTVFNGQSEMVMLEYTRKLDQEKIIGYAFPIVDSEGKVYAITLVQDSIDETEFFARLICVSLLVMVGLIGIVLALIFSSYISKRVVKPIKEMAEVAGNSIKDVLEDENLDEKSKEKIHAFSEMNYKKNNTEVDTVQEAFVKLEEDINRYTDDITRMAKEKERLNAELDLARSIQQSYLSSEFPDRSDFDLFAINYPAKEVGGDFYDFCEIDDNHIAMIIADVSDKGVPAALFMMTAKTMIASQLRYNSSPGKLLEEVNKLLCENNEESLFVTVWIGILDISTGNVIAANAGHEHPVVVRDGEAVSVDGPVGFVLGGLEGMTYEDYDFQINKGDALFLYTDGVTDATNAGDEMFGIDRLKDSLLKAKQDTAGSKEFVERIYGDICEFSKDHNQFDDITMLVGKL